MNSNQRAPRIDYHKLVPDYMRTKRKTPRVLATLCCATALLYLHHGTLALAKIKTVENNSIIGELSNGSSYYLLGDRDEKNSCLGSFKLTIQPGQEKGNDLNLLAKFPLHVLQTTHLVTLDGLAQFDELFELNKLNAIFNLGRIGKLTIKNNKEEKLLNLLLVTSSGQYQSLSFAGFERIYLLETQKNKYRLRLPKTLKNIPLSLAALDSSPLALTKSDETQYNSCSKKLEEESRQPLLSIPITDKNLNDSQFLRSLINSLGGK